MSFYSSPVPRLHDLTHSPAGLWQFQGTPNDSSGNGYTLTWTGTPMYSVMGDSLRAALFMGTNRLSRASTAGLQLVGDMTLEMMVCYDGMPGVTTITKNSGIVAMGKSGELEADNICYSLRMLNTVSAGIRIFSETGAGSNQSYDFNKGPAPFGIWHHEAYVRESNVWKLYYNGIHSDTSGTMLASGGTDSIFNVGASQTGADLMRGSIASLKIIASALTAAQVLAEARLCGFA